MTYYKEKKGLNISSKNFMGRGGWLIDSGFFFYHWAEGNFDKSKRGAD